MNIFNYPFSESEAVISAGEDFFVPVWNFLEHFFTWMHIRYHFFMKAVAKCRLHSRIQFSTLPTTSSVARENSSKYWFGFEPPPLTWGWNLI